MAKTATLFSPPAKLFGAVQDPPEPRRGWSDRRICRSDGREWPGALARFGRVGQRVLDEHRVAREAAAVVELVDIKLVLPLDRDEDPGLGRMKIEMARPKAQPVAGRDRGEVASVRHCRSANVLIAPGSSGLPASA